MKYTLMHKDIPVVDIEISLKNLNISHVKQRHNINHLPVGVSSKKNSIRSTLNEWLKGRSIPASRDGIKEALSKMNVKSADVLIEKSFGLSLSDAYWLCPENSDLGWNNINFFKNDFSEDVGDALFGMEIDFENMNFISPDNTSDGWLKKKWKIIDTKRCLIKSGSLPAFQEPFNEAIASIICKALNIFHVPYTVILIDNEPYSVCENFVTEDTELVSAFYIMKTAKKENDTSVHAHLLNCTKSLSIPNMVDAVNKMIVLDFLMMNEDRHQNNFGALRNSNTLEWIGEAPIFDTGTSLCFNRLETDISQNAKITCKPFKTKHEEQLKLVSSFDFLDIGKLKKLKDEIFAVPHITQILGEKRVLAIYNAFIGRVEMLEKFISLNKDKSLNFDYEVTEDIKYSGK